MEDRKVSACPGSLQFRLIPAEDRRPRVVPAEVEDDRGGSRRPLNQPADRGRQGRDIEVGPGVDRPFHPDSLRFQLRPEIIGAEVGVDGIQVDEDRGYPLPYPFFRQAEGKAGFPGAVVAGDQDERFFKKAAHILPLSLPAAADRCFSPYYTAKTGGIGRGYANNL